jgi:cytoskeletal protein CcmA (bactofilin family)
LAHAAVTGIQSGAGDLSLTKIIKAVRRRLGLRFRRAAPAAQPRRLVSDRSKPTEDREMADQADDLGLPIKPVRPPVQPVVPPRFSDLPRPGGAGSEARPTSDAPSQARTDQVERRTMIVGREISLAGDISSCDRLVVEGSVEANLHECRELNIAESGLFKGNASIEQAEVRGRFEGDLVIRKRLMIRASGHVAGSISYGELEIECGGKISGTVQANQEDSTTAYLGRARAG